MIIFVLMFIFFIINMSFLKKPSFLKIFSNFLENVKNFSYFYTDPVSRTSIILVYTRTKINTRIINTSTILVWVPEKFSL